MNIPSGNEVYNIIHGALSAFHEEASKVSAPLLSASEKVFSLFLRQNFCFALLDFIVPTLILIIPISLLLKAKKEDYESNWCKSDVNVLNGIAIALMIINVLVLVFCYINGFNRLMNPEINAAIDMLNILKDNITK